MSDVASAGQDVWTYSKEEFMDILTSESHVDVVKLREAARFGIPSSVRGEVWAILMGVNNFDNSDNTSSRLDYAYKVIQNEKLYDLFSFETLTLIRKDIVSYISTISLDFQFSRPREARAKIEKILLVYLSNNSERHYSPVMVHTLSPLVKSMTKESSIYYSFCYLTDLLEYHFGDEKIKMELATFLMLFRNLHGGLYAYFEEQNLNVNEWALIWFKSLLANILPLRNIVRLWDTYFSTEEGLNLHIYVCLALLMRHKEVLMDFEYTELRGFLLRLPGTDMDQIILHAYNIREQCVALKLL